MKSIMIVVADSSRARIFTTDSPTSPLQEIQTMAHPEGRMHEQNMVSDLPGKDSGIRSGSGHAYQEIIEPKQQEITEFAKRIADYLEEARNSGKIISQLIVAAPALLGTLRKHMSDKLNDMVAFELDKNLTRHSVEDIRSHLPKYLTH